MTCTRCHTPLPENYRSPRNCAFKTGTFDSDNYMCGTMNELRAGLIDRDTSYPKASHQYYEDHSFAMYPTDNERDCNGSGFVALSWYKDRGRTERAVYEGGLLTLAVAEAILNAWAPLEHVLVNRLEGTQP